MAVTAEGGSGTELKSDRRLARCLSPYQKCNHLYDIRDNWKIRLEAFTKSDFIYTPTTTTAGVEGQGRLAKGQYRSDGTHVPFHKATL